MSQSSPTDATQLGHIRDLWRYPVKSTLGEAVDELPLNERGVVGDRLFAIQDSTGKLGSGKLSRRFNPIPGLFGLSSRLDGERAMIRYPSGEWIAGDDPRTHERLSECLGQTVSLVRESKVEHLDAGPIHLLSQSSLDWLGEQIDGRPSDARRFRPNFVLETSLPPLSENEWIGRTLRIGDEVRVLVQGRTQRCVMTGFSQADLQEEPGVLRTLAKETGADFGIYLRPIVCGLVRRGDAVHLED